jgi:hypothetical protein
MKLSSLPELQGTNNQISYIWPEYLYVAKNKRSNTFIRISENQLKKCKSNARIIDIEIPGEQGLTDIKTDLSFHVENLNIDKLQNRIILTNKASRPKEKRGI